MVRVSKVKTRELRRGWMKWALLPLAFFSVLFFDAWLNIQMRYKDYDLSKLSETRFSLETQLADQESRLAQFRGKSLQSIEAKELGLRSPEINQVHTIAYREVEKRISVMHLEGFQTAQTAPVIKSVLLAEPALPENLNTPAAPLENSLSPAATDDPSVAAPALIVKNENPLPAAPDVPAEHVRQADPDLDFFSVEDMITAL